MKFYFIKQLCCSVFRMLKLNTQTRFQLMFICSCNKIFNIYDEVYIAMLHNWIPEWKTNWNHCLTIHKWMLTLNKIRNKILFSLKTVDCLLCTFFKHSGASVGQQITDGSDNCITWQDTAGCAHEIHLPRVWKAFRRVISNFTHLAWESVQCWWCWMYCKGAYWSKKSLKLRWFIYVMLNCLRFCCVLHQSYRNSCMSRTVQRQSFHTHWLVSLTFI